MSKEESFAHIYKKIDATSKTRFHAARRLRLHAKFSTYTIVIISLGLILISLMQAYDFVDVNADKYVGLIQVFSSIAILVFSLLIDKNNFSSISEKMYSCASKLGYLKQRLQPLLEKDYDEETYMNFQKEYETILTLYETHSNNDFRGDNYRARLEMPENYKINGIDWWIAKLNIWYLHMLDFSLYPIVLIILASVIGWIFLGIA